MIKVKICGLRNEKDVENAAGAGVDAAGFLVGQIHTSEDFIIPSTARRLAAALPLFITPVLVTHLRETDKILELIDLTGIYTVQLHGGTTPEELSHLKEETGDDVKFISVFHVLRGEGTVPDPANYEELADAFLLDSMNAAEGRVGGTGIPHDWNVSRNIVETTCKPVILAGGLFPGNVQEAVQKVHPFAVDANSRLKDGDGNLDAHTAADFVAKAKGML